MLQQLSLVVVLFALQVAHLDAQMMCAPQSQQAIRQCSIELRQLGIFTQSSGEIDALTWEQIRRRSRQYFNQLCDSYRRFDQCIQPYKARCWYEEPIKREFSVATEALGYICGDGYYGMLNNWDCFIQAAQRSEVMQCEQRVMADARGGAFADMRQGDAACRVLQDYMSCIKRPINDQCGMDAWSHVREAVQRPTRVYLPYCTLAGVSHLPSIITVFVGLLLASLFWKIQ